MYFYNTDQKVERAKNIRKREKKEIELETFLPSDLSHQKPYSL